MRKVYVYFDSADSAARSTVQAGVDEVIAVYGMRTLARATDEQSRALMEAGFRVELADREDLLILDSVIIDTTAPAPSPPAGWAGPGNDVWLVQFVGPPLPDWVEAVRNAGAEVLGLVSSSALMVRISDAQAQAVEDLGRVQWIGRYEPLYKIHPELAREDGPVPAAQIERLAAADDSEGGTAAEEAYVKIEVFNPSNLSDVANVMEANGGSIEEATANIIIGHLPQAAIRTIARMPETARISRYAPPELDLQRARPITSVQAVVDTHGLDGEGETVGIADSGLDRGVDNETLHTDYKEIDGVTTGRVIRGYLPQQVNPALAPVFQRNSWSDPNGHGTHVAGIALGNGMSLEGRPQSGVAYQARLVIQALRDNGNPAAGIIPRLRGLPNNLLNLFTPVYDQDGVRVHNNSWGSTAALASYGANAHEVDQFVWRNPDMVIVFSAGNSGTDRTTLGTGAPPAEGVVDFGSVGQEKTFRNGVTVGASENNRPEIATQYGTHWPGDYPVNPLNSDPLANAPEQMAPFSSRGPTDLASGNRIKPDVVAPGASIFAPYSSISPTSNTWGPRPAGSPYIYKGGTSMAAPHVTGMCALIRQYLREVHSLSDPNNPNRRRRRPSAALIKALLVHGARRIQGRYPQPFHAVDNSGTVPGNHQGWGRVDLRRSLFSHPPNSLVAPNDQDWLPRRTVFIDSPTVTLNGLPAPNPNSRVTRDVRVTVANASVPLRATLVWTDYPGLEAGTASFTAHPGTVLNQLQLSIVRVSDGHTYNVVDPPGLLPAPAAPPVAPPPPAPQPPPAPPLAHRNNVQQIDIPTAGVNALAAGDYIVRVTAPTVLPSVALAGDEQDFALVISGPISRSDHANPGNMARLPDLAFVDLHNATGNGRVLHDGLPPSPERPAGNPGSPDIWVSREQNPDPARAVNRIEAGRTHYVYVRVHNLGFADANNAQLSLYWADPSTPMTFPGDWHTDGFEFGNVPTNQTNVDVPARGNRVAGPFKWTPPGDREFVSLFARVEHPDDPIRHANNLRMDNNVTRRDVFIQNNATSVQEEPGFFGKFWFWIISGFGTPRDIEARWLMYYEDVTDGEVKPMPPGVTVEVWDYDPVAGDDKLAQGRTASSADPQGEPASALHLTFSTYESGERSPDLYLKVLAPSGEGFSDFRQRSYFINGAPHWMSNLDPNGGGRFYGDDFSGNRLGIPTPVSVVMRPRGIAVHAALEYQDMLSEEFERLPAGIPVKIMDSKVSAPSAVLGRATTDANGEIRTVLQRRTDHQPSIYFLIERDHAVHAFTFVSYFWREEHWDSRTQQGEIVAPDDSVLRTVPGHFENWTDRRLVAEGERLRFRLGSPTIFVHLRFEYFDREKGAFQPLPKGVQVQVWEDDAAAASPLVVGTVGDNGRADLAVPKGGRQRLNLYARVVMRKRLGGESPVQPDVRVHNGGSVVTWDTKGRTATDGTAGLFPNVETNVATAAAPLVFRIGTGPADANVELAAPFILKVVGELHDWLRIRTANEWQGISSLQINLFNDGAAGSRFDAALLPSTIDLNTGNTAPASAQLDTANPQPDHWNRLVIAHHYGHSVIETNMTDLARTAVSVANHRNYRAEAEQAATLAGRRLAFAEGFADFLAFRHLAQDGRPSADVSAGGWTGSTGGNLFSNVAAPDDSSVIRSSVNPASDACEIRLSAVTDPRTDATFVPFTPLRASGYLVRFRFRNTESTRQIRLSVKLMQGATEIASWSLLSTSSDWTTAVRTLTPQQADSITNYANLRLRFIATAHSGPRQRIEISWAEFELPHPARPDRDARQRGWRGPDNDGAKNSGEIVPVAVANALWHLDATVVGWGHAGIEEPINQRRFLGLIWNPIWSLQTNNVQIPYHLYRAVQSAGLGDNDWIDRAAAKTRQEVRRVFEANGMLFTRGQIHAPPLLQAENLAAVPPRSALATFQLRPADRARLNVAEMGRIKAYRIDAAPAGTTNFVELDTFTSVTAANQRETVVVNLTEARQTGVLAGGGIPHDFRVRAMDEFDAWDTFADNLLANSDTPPNTGVIDNDTWLRNRLRTTRPLPADPAINVP